jgi:hypothetical protein
MKNTKNNFITIGITLFGVFLFSLSCQKDDVMEDIIIELKPVEQAFKTKLVTSTEIPSIMDMIKSETKNIYPLNNSNSFANSTESGDNYGHLDLENNIETLDTLGNTNYSFKFTNINSNQLLIHNLIIHKDEDGNIDAPYVIKYTMTENFATEYYLGNKHFGEFTGTMSHYLLDAFFNNQSSLNSFSTNNEDTPTLDCPCDEATFSSGGNTNTSGSNSGSNTTGTPGSVTSITSSSSGGGGVTCYYLVVTTPCSCEGHTNPNACTCSTPPIVSRELLYCAYKRPSSARSESTDCETDANGLCPEDNGYVSVNTISGVGIFIENRIIDSNLDPCSKEILTNLENLETNDIANILNRFGSPTSIYDWEIKTGTPTNINNAAETNWAVDSNNNAIDNSYLTIIKTSYINQATKLAIARTILHESIHAYIISYIDDLAGGNIQGFSTEFPDLWNNFVSKKYGVPADNIENYQHQEMAENFINIIRDALAEYDNNQQDGTYYEHLAWGALMNTDAFERALAPGGYMNQSEQEAILIANNQEDTNGPLAKGTPCN